MKVQSMMADAANMLTAGFSCNKASTGFSDIMNKAAAGNVADTSKNQQNIRQTGTAPKNPVQETKAVEKMEKAEAGTVEKQAVVSDQKQVPRETKELVENEIKEVVQEGLGISEEELEEAMSVLALGYLDLLSQENLKALTMYVNGTSDISDILMNDDLSTMLTQLIDDLAPENIAESAGVTVQEIEQLLTENSEFLDQVIMTEESIGTTDSGLPTGDEAAAETSAMPEVTVVKETETLTAKEPASENPGEAAKEAVGNTNAEAAEEFTASGGKDGFLEDRQEAGKQDLANEVVNNIVSTVQETTVSADGTMTMTTVEMRQVVIQVVEQIKVVIRPEQTNMQMTLYPEHLGRLQLMVTSRDGVMTANFTVQNEMVRQALETQMQELKNAFEEQGLKVEAVEVTVASFEFNQSDETGNGKEQQGQKKPSGKTLSLEDAFLEEVESDLEEEAAASISGTGTNINYTA